MLKTISVCVLDFGFSQSSFSGSEQRESYRVQVKFFSGGITTGFFFTLSLNLSGTASKYKTSSVYTSLIMITISSTTRKHNNLTIKAMGDMYRFTCLLKVI